MPPFGLRHHSGKLRFAHHLQYEMKRCAGFAPLAIRQNVHAITSVVTLPDFDSARGKTHSSSNGRRQSATRLPRKERSIKPSAFTVSAPKLPSCMIGPRKRRAGQKRGLQHGGVRRLPSEGSPVCTPSPSCFSTATGSSTCPAPTRSPTRSARTAACAWRLQPTANSVYVTEASPGEETPLRRGQLFKADTLEALAVQIGVDLATFTAEMERYNSFCEAGRTRISDATCSTI